MKSSKLTPTLLMCGLLGMAAGAARSVAAETVAARDLGIPVTSANLISYRAARGWGHEGGDLLCWVTTAESGAHFSAMDLGSGSVLTYTLNHLEGYPIVFGSDHRVYVGSTSGEVLRWDPQAKSWGTLGKPLFAVPGRGVNHVRALCEGPGRWLYAGSCTGERARIHQDTAEVQKLPEPEEKGNWYVSAVAALPDGRIAFGFGHVARIFVYDPATGKDIGQWLPQGWTEDGFCVNLLVGRSVLYAWHFPSGRRAAFDTATGRFLGQVPWPDAVSGQQWSKWIHSSGYGSGIDFYLLPGTDTVVNCDGQRVYTARGWHWLVAELARVREIAQQARILANSATARIVPSSTACGLPVRSHAPGPADERAGCGVRPAPSARGGVALVGDLGLPGAGV